jgi:hypothetical protein
LRIFSYFSSLSIIDMPLISILGFTLFVFIITYILTAYGNLIEPFADPSPNVVTEVTNAITISSEVICPSFEEVIQLTMQDKQGTDDEKRKQAIRDLTKEAKVPLFPCPPPDDPLQIPADIGDRMVHTINFLFKKLLKAKLDIHKSLNECPSDGFKNMCSPDQEAIKQQKEEEESAKSCISSANVSTEDKNIILKARLASINTGLSAKLTGEVSFTDGLARVRQMAKNLKETKAKAESGQIQTNCAK